MVALKGATVAVQEGAPASTSGGEEADTEVTKSLGEAEPLPTTQTDGELAEAMDNLFAEDDELSLSLSDLEEDRTVIEVPKSNNA